MNNNKVNMKTTAQLYNTRARHRRWDEQQDTSDDSGTVTHARQMAAISLPKREERSRNDHFIGDEVTVFDGVSVLAMEIHKFDVGIRVVLIDTQGFFHWAEPTKNLEESEGALFIMMFKDEAQRLAGYTRTKHLADSQAVIEDRRHLHRKVSHVYQ